MIVIIDTNVLVSAILKDRDPETVVLFAAETAAVRWVASAAILAEYRSVLARPKFALPSELLARWIELLDRVIEVREVAIASDFPRDQKDAMFLACALAMQADFLSRGIGTLSSGVSPSGLDRPSSFQLRCSKLWCVNGLGMVKRPRAMDLALEGFLS